MPFYYMPAAETFLFCMTIRKGTLFITIFHISSAVIVYFFVLTQLLEVDDMCLLDWRLNETAQLQHSNYGVRCGYHYLCCGLNGRNYHCPNGPHAVSSDYKYLCCYTKYYLRGHRHANGRYRDIWDDPDNTYEPMKTRGYRSLLWVKWLYLVVYFLKTVVAVACMIHILAEIEQGTFWFDSYVYYMMLDCVRCGVMIILLSQILGNEELELGWPHYNLELNPNKFECYNCDVLVEVATNLLYLNIFELIAGNFYFIFVVNSYNIEAD